MTEKKEKERKVESQVNVDGDKESLIDKESQ